MVLKTQGIPCHSTNHECKNTYIKASHTLNTISCILRYIAAIILHFKGTNSEAIFLENFEEMFFNTDRSQ